MEGKECAIFLFIMGIIPATETGQTSCPVVAERLHADVGIIQVMITHKPSDDTDLSEISKVCC